MIKKMNRHYGIRSRAIAAMAVSAALFALTACNSQGSIENAASPGGTISIAEFVPDHLTPGWGNGYNEDLSHALFAPLVGFGADNEVQLVQAESITTSDNQVWTVKIKPGWTFHNGEEVTAQSYVDGLNTTAYGPNAWSGNSQLTGVEGYDALNPKGGKPTSTTLSGLKVIDPQTFQVTLRSPDSQLLVEMGAGYAWSPLPKAALTDLAAYDKAPIGNGPFQIEGKWENPTADISVSAYPAYKGTKPKVGNIVFKVYNSAEAAYTDLLAGNVDLNGKFTTLPSSKLAQVKSDFSGRVVTKPQISTQWLGFPLADKRYSDVGVRQAISMAIDRETITSKIFGGLYTPATGLLSPGTMGGATDSCGAYCKFDPNKAKALLAAAGGWAGPMEIHYAAGKGNEAYVQAVANDIRQNLGISDVVLVGAPTSPDYTAALAAGTNGPFTSSWSPSSPTPLSILSQVFQTASIYNSRSGFYSSAAVDSLTEQAKSAKTPEEATGLFHDAEARVMKDLPVAPMYNPHAVVAYSDRIEAPLLNVSGPMIDQLALK